MKQIGLDWRAAAVASLLLFAGCASPSTPPPAAAVVPPPTSYTILGLEAVIGSTARALVGQFGRPDLELREGQAHKLQFIGPACVLDAYLYPPRSGPGEPVVTHVDARLPDGREMDRSSCVAALSARQQSR